MTDRELLELAAKAAGYGFIRWETDEDGVDLAVVNHGYWQPLYMNTSTSCDGDALRLAVKLRIGNLWAMQEWSRQDPEEANTAWESDPYTATRRAITRAAAEIGKEKQNA